MKAIKIIFITILSGTALFLLAITGLIIVNHHSENFMGEAFAEWIVDIPGLFTEPVWTETHFSNKRITSTESNGSMASHIREFYHTYASQIDTLYQQMDEEKGYQIDPAISPIFREALAQGFKEDTFSQSQPFNQDFWQLVLDNTLFYFASPRIDELPYVGLYAPLEEEAHVFVSLGENHDEIDDLVNAAREEGLHALEEEWRIFHGHARRFFDESEWRAIEESWRDVIAEWFAEMEDERTGRKELLTYLHPYDEEEFIFVALHEMGHALGLGDSLSDLLAEKYTGMEIPHASRAKIDSNWFRDIRNNLKWLSDIKNAEEFYDNFSIEMLTGVRSDSSLIYNSAFDRVLLNTAGSEPFWKAAYTSNSAYGELWNEHMRDAISHYEIQLIRGLVMEAALENPKLWDDFIKHTDGVNLSWASIIILDNFQQLINPSNGRLDSSFMENHIEAFIRFRVWVDTLTEFANANEVSLVPSVYDFIIEQHSYYNN